MATQRLTSPFLLLIRIKKVYFRHFKRDQFCFLLDVSFERAGQAADSQQDIESDVEYKRCLLLKMAEKHHQTGANGQSGQSKHLPGLHPQNLVMIYLIFAHLCPGCYEQTLLRSHVGNFSGNPSPKLGS